MAMAERSLATDGRGVLSPDGWLAALARRSESIVIPLGALVAGLAVFGLFLLTQGKSPA